MMGQVACAQAAQLEPVCVLCQQCVVFQCRFACHAARLGPQTARLAAELPTQALTGFSNAKTVTVLAGSAAVAEG